MIWRQLWITLKRAWPACMLVLGFFIAFIIGWLVGDTGSDRMRYAGTGLQLLGLGTVAYGLSYTRSLFGHPSVPQRIARWCGELVAAVRAKSTPHSRKHSAADTIGMRDDLQVHPASTKTSLEDRVERLEKDIKDLGKDLNRKSQEQRNATAEVGKQVEEESMERKNAVTETNAQIENVAIGGLHIETIGVVWLVFGILATSLASEIASLSMVLIGR